MANSLKTEGRVTYSSEDLNIIKDFKNQDNISITGFEPISPVTIHSHNPLGELMGKINEIVDRMNTLTELVTKHIIGR